MPFLLLLNKNFLEEEKTFIFTNKKSAETFLNNKTVELFEFEFKAANKEDSKFLNVPYIDKNQNFLTIKNEYRNNAHAMLEIRNMYLSHILNPLLINKKLSRDLFIKKPKMSKEQQKEKKANCQCVKCHYCKDQAEKRKAKKN